jgi:NAD(P)-dependent dehydrogenase (short-subunit alcohol dehydrogenase family)
MGRLDKRVAIVTGGSSGIGRGIAIAFAREGARVVVADVQAEPRRGKYHETEPRPPTAEQIEADGGTAAFVATDVSSPEQIERMVSFAADRFGGLDILVNNAGVGIVGTADAQSDEEWELVISINLRAPFLATRGAVPYLRASAHGRVINIASVHAFGGSSGPAYASSKAALVNMTRDAALTLGADGITVNAICPGYIETPIQDYLTPQQIDAVREKTAMPRLGKPEDIGRAAVFFASDDAQWVTGAALLVDGGLTASI